MELKDIAEFYNRENMSKKKGKNGTKKKVSSEEFFNILHQKKVYRAITI